MLRVKNEIVKQLYAHTQKPVIPNTDTQNRPPYPFIDYSVIAVVNESGQGNYSLEAKTKDANNKLDLQKRLSLSINVYSNKEAECYNLAKQVWEYLKHVGVEDLAGKGIVIIDITESTNRTILEVNQYETRYGFDVFVRFDNSIIRHQDTIENYDITGRIIKE